MQELKKVWEEPKLFVHGDVEEITQAMYKHKGFGTSDGLLFSVEHTLSTHGKSASCSRHSFFTRDDHAPHNKAVAHESS
jgi:hypothetical protein